MLQDSDSPLPWRPWQWVESWHGPLKESWRERIAVYCTPKDVHTSRSRVFHEHSILLRHHHILHSVREARMDSYLLKQPMQQNGRIALFFVSQNFFFFFLDFKTFKQKKVPNCKQCVCFAFERSLYRVFMEFHYKWADVRCIIIVGAKVRSWDCITYFSHLIILTITEQLTCPYYHIISIFK